jgi:transposase-like protein
MLYRILNLSTEYISPIIKKRMEILATSYVDEFCSSDKYDQVIFGDKSALVNKWKRRYLKAAKISRQKELIDVYLSDPDSFVLPSKA